MRLLLPAVLTLTWLAAARGAEPELELRLRLEPGQQLHFRQVGERQSTIEANDEKHFIVEVGGWDCVFDIREREANGTLAATVSFPAVYFRRLADEGNSVYDSTAKADAPVPYEAWVLAAFVGKSVTCRLSPRGRVSDVVGTAEILQALRTRLASDKAIDPNARLVTEIMLKEYDDTGLADKLQALFCYVADQPVAAHATWKDARRLAGAYPGDAQDTYTLRRFDAGTAWLTVNSELRTLADNPPYPAATDGYRLGLTAENRGTGNYQIARDTGQVTFAAVTDTTTGRFHLLLPTEGVSVQPFTDKATTVILSGARLQDAKGRGWDIVALAGQSVPAEDREQIRALVRQLAAGDFKARRSARDELKGLDDTARLVLEEFRDDPDPEIRLAIRELLDQRQPGK